MAYSQAIAIPAQYKDLIDQIHFNKNIPRSWLAAVCEATGWDPNFKRVNASNNTVRRIGIAGLWLDIPEIRLACINGSCPISGIVDAGWAPQNPYILSMFYRCAKMPTGGTLRNWANSPGLFIEPILNTAADLLLDSAQVIIEACGELNDLAFLRWQLGCRYIPEKDASGKCIYPPGLPPIFKAEVDDIIVAQCLFAPEFSEDCFLTPPGTRPVVTLSASPLGVKPNQPVTFIASATGGSPPYSYTFNFGHGTPITTSTPTASHSYPLEGNFTAFVTVADAIGNLAQSNSITINVTTVPLPPDNKFLWLGLLGLLGLAGLAAVKGDKRGAAAEKRRQAAELRAKARDLRAKGKSQEADRLEAKASQLEREATQLDEEAARDEKERAARKEGKRP